MSVQDLLNMYPHLSTKYVAKLVTQIGVSPQFMASTLMPTKNINDYEVRWDVKLGVGGMTQAVAMGAESPIVSGGGFYQRRMFPAFFREKQHVMPHTLMWKRRLGTLNEMENVQQFIDEKIVELKQRVDVRVEHSLWQAILGTLNINSNRIKFSVDYAVPARFQPVLTGGDRWSQLTTATPLDDLLDWFYLFRGTGFQASEVIFNAKVQKYLYQNSSIRELVKAVITGGRPSAGMSPEVFNQVAQVYVPGVKFTMFDGFYTLTTESMAAVAVGGNTMVVNDASHIEAGDQVRVINYSDNGDVLQDQFLTIASTPTTTTLTFSETFLYAFAAGTFVLVTKSFLPDDKVIIKGAYPTGIPNIAGENPYGNFYTTLSEYGEGNILAPKPGVFAETVINDKADPKRIDIICGINGLPIRYRNDDFIVATIA